MTFGYKVSCWLVLSRTRLLASARSGFSAGRDLLIYATLFRLVSFALVSAALINNPNDLNYREPMSQSARSFARPLIRP